jgi:hypothetical protein
MSAATSPRVSERLIPVEPTPSTIALFERLALFEHLVDVGVTADLVPFQLLVRAIHYCGDGSCTEKCEVVIGVIGPESMFDPDDEGQRRAGTAGLVRVGAVEEIIDALRLAARPGSAGG